MALKKALLAATMLALPVVAKAQPVTGFYVGAGVGTNMLMETDTSLVDGSNLGRFGFDPGVAGVISLGYSYGNGLRAEIEGSFRQNNASSISGFVDEDGGLVFSGRARSYGVMANVLYDFDLGSSFPLVPYIGVGAGYVWHQYDARIFVRDVPEIALAIDDQQGRFAYQAIVGASLPLGSVVPGLALTAEYRFMGTLQTDLDLRISYGPLSEPVGKMQVDNFNHSVLLGIRYAFNAAPPPVPVVAPAPAVVPAPARTFLVFFDFDRADLTDRARAIIAEAATNAGRVGTTRIEIAGHADRSGTPQYNQALSERRAAAVAAELERRGIARSAMTVQAFGESRPLVPTADGVREPQNRRVEIVLR